jgi:DnaJ-class molecular chaperone
MVLAMFLIAIILWLWLRKLQHMVLFDNPYKVLGVTPQASMTEVATAYRNQSSQFHSQIR